jgi:hypothetical protein
VAEIWQSNPSGTECVGILPSIVDRKEAVEGPRDARACSWSESPGFRSSIGSLWILFAWLAFER